jgi:hypothetical protein
MEPKKANGSSRLANLNQLTVYEYEDGSNSATFWRMDPGTRRMIPSYLSGVEQPAREPFSSAELLLMAALETYADYLQDTGQLP